MEIKQVTPSDINELAGVALQSYNEHYLYLWHDGGKKYISNNFTAEILSQQLKDKNAMLFLVYVKAGASPVGFLKVNINKPFTGFDEKASIELERIYLIQEASRAGLGKKLLDFVETLAKQFDKKMIWLKVMDSSPAVHFYKHAGYKIVGQHRLTFPEMKDEYRGMHVMAKEL